MMPATAGRVAPQVESMPFLSLARQIYATRLVLGSPRLFHELAISLYLSMAEMKRLSAWLKKQDPVTSKPCGHQNT